MKDGSNSVALVILGLLVIYFYIMSFRPYSEEHAKYHLVTDNRDYYCNSYTINNTSISFTNVDGQSICLVNPKISIIAQH